MPLNTKENHHKTPGMKHASIPKPLLLTCLGIFVLNLAAAIQARGQNLSSSRSVKNFDSGWRFHYGDVPGAEVAGFDDTT